ncbi:DarT1-associated NADAR antitoxin family protein [Bradyrhizobium sp. HKCCYLR20261]|uniref:DarT1-associated NADAR antitoxin family protein n=1 Tax=Bradyrhizobium sp. HKCCYLR20261 TaxID=3420760 RepID=UPI003EC017CF
MAERPVFVPSLTGSQLVQLIWIKFPWHPGLAASQKKKNIVELHGAAATRGLEPLLEISSKSDEKVGRNLSAFHLKLAIDERETTVECAYQGSKVFEHGGPYVDLYWKESREAKRDPRLRDSGKLLSFEFEGKKYPIAPMTVFYDWLYFKALYPHRAWIEKREEWAGFTDIEFNPERSINCQARSFAAFIALQKRNELDVTVASFHTFRARWEAAGL